MTAVMNLTRRVGIVRRAGRTPESQAGLELFASLLRAEDASQVERSVLALGGDEVRAAHRHNADVALCVTRGCLVFSVGPVFEEQASLPSAFAAGGAGELVLRPGDYLFVPAGVAHREAALQNGAELVVAHLVPSDMARSSKT
jgi:quercetin dioxygenase-like cupin family protein